MNHKLLQTKDLQQNNGTDTEPQQKLTEGHFGDSSEVQTLAPVEQENDTYLRPDIARRLRADESLISIVEQWESLPEHIKAAIKTLAQIK